MRTFTPRTLGNSASFLTAAAVIVIALWSSGSPAMVYPLYEQSWSLTATTITEVFAVYPVVMVITLVVFGSLSDSIGRRAAMLAGLVSIMVGVLVFALAPDVAWLFVGRVFQGLGVGLALSPAGAALVEYSGSRSKAGSANTVAIAIGLALATLVGGGLLQYAPWPRALTFWVLLVITALVTVAALFLPRKAAAASVQGGPVERWRPQAIHVPREIRGVVITAALAVTSTFALGAVLISLGAQLVKTVLHTDNALVAGAVLAVGSVATGAVSLTLRRLSPRPAVVLGGIVGAVSTGALVASAALSSLALFAVAAIAFGVSGGLLFLGALGLINGHAPAQHRAATLSVVYLVAYIGQGVSAVSLGVLTTAVGLPSALDLLGPLLILLSLATAATALVTTRVHMRVNARQATGCTAIDG
ncbi:MFS transporter [Microbacterium sp. STN6]|uniref:MFS transporter n=1 Tax=Microbacterium sp. STN6 TaxID=2995588 RepID=UPI0022608248|nr:MFS transporter [Microbacterium sp. STN6]MCX7520682.1 MFS transporter [Microbacterium sp. STN6]